jgi:hypothetical protein
MAPRSDGAAVACLREAARGRVRSLLAIATGATLAFVVPGTAPGAISLVAPGAASFAATLTGIDQTATYSVALTTTVTLANRAAGWHLDGSATQLTGPGGETLLTTAQQVTSVAQGGCTVAATNSVGVPVTLGAAAAKFFNAAGNTGTGTCTITPTITVSIVAKSKAVVYTSTLTFALVAGP